MQKLLFDLAILLVLSSTITYSILKQCDPAWRNDQLGTSRNKICSDGCLMSSALMALVGTVKLDITPAILNK